jgi:hypothetical protein
VNKEQVRCQRCGYEFAQVVALNALQALSVDIPPEVKAAVRYCVDGTPHVFDITALDARRGGK